MSLRKRQRVELPTVVVSRSRRSEGPPLQRACTRLAFHADSGARRGKQPLDNVQEVIVAAADGVKESGSAMVTAVVGQPGVEHLAHSWFVTKVGKTLWVADWNFEGAEAAGKDVAELPAKDTQTWDTYRYMNKAIAALVDADFVRFMTREITGVDPLASSQTYKGRLRMPMEAGKDFDAVTAERGCAAFANYVWDNRRLILPRLVEDSG